MTDYSKSIRNILLILTIIVVFFILKALSGLLIPLVLAGLLTVLGLPLVTLLEKKKVPRLIVTLLVAGLTLLVVMIVVTLISGTVEQLIQDKEFLASQFSKKIQAAAAGLEELIPSISSSVLQQELDKAISPGKIAALLGSVLGSLGSFGSSFVLFLIYYLIFISGATGYRAYVDYVTGPDQEGETREVWKLTQDSITAYMSIKTVISLITGLLAGIVCWAFGLQFALFWGFLAFLLNYIPSIGSMLATVIPVFMAVIQFDSAGMVLGILICLGASQFVIGSVIDPMIMGNRLRLNTVTVIFGLVFWGYIWGIPGMLLSVPLMVMIRLLLERSDDFAIIARIMGNPIKPGKKKTTLLNRIIGNGKSGNNTSR